MSNGVRYSLNLQISAGTEEALTEFAREHLISQGYHVAAPNDKWEKLGEFMIRVGMANYESVHRSIDLFRQRGGTIVVDRTRTGRVMGIMSNVEFDKFVKRNCVILEAKAETK